MEKIIYTEACARLSTAEAVAYLLANSFTLKTLDWFQDQITQALLPESEGNKSNPFDYPALFFQFSPTKYSGMTGQWQQAEGELILHVVQERIGIDGIQGGSTINDFKAKLDLCDLLVNILTDGQLQCSARLVRTNVERDHTNIPLLWEKITFRWQGRSKTVAIPAIP